MSVSGAYRLVMANVPELRELADYPFAAVNAKLKAVAEADGIEYLDLLPALQRETPADLWVTVPDPSSQCQGASADGRSDCGLSRAKTSAP